MRRLTKALLATSLVLPAVLSAHPGHDGHDVTWEFSTGALHPLSGVDHVLAMVAVGAWAFQLGGRARWLLPTAFVGTMALGAVAGQAGLHFGYAEQAIAASVLVLGLLIAGSARIGSWLSTSLVSLFALFHGLAHGAELPTGTPFAGYALGFVTVTAVLHAGGYFGASLLSRESKALRAGGLLVAAAGLALLA